MLIMYSGSMIRRAYSDWETTLDFSSIYSAKHAKIKKTKRMSVFGGVMMVSGDNCIKKSWWHQVVAISIGDSGIRWW